MGVKKRVLLVDDHDVVRAGLQWLLERHDDFEVVGQASDGLEAVRQARRLSPDLVATDVCMPNMNGIDAVRQIKEEVPGAKIIMVSEHEGRQSVLESLAAGADGYILKTKATEEFVLALQAALRGDLYVSPPVARYIVGETGAKRRPADEAADQLSSRERRVLRLVAEGKSSKQIAYMLGIEESTVVVHRRNIMNKLELHSVAELTRYAILSGITPLVL